MLRSISRITCLTTVALAISVMNANAATPGSQLAQTAAPGAGDEGWSFDDIKDVCEAVHFVAISIGIGVGLWWFCLRYVPRDISSRIEFHVEVAVGGELDSCRLLEVVAVISNLSRHAVPLAECRFTLAAVTPAGGSPAHGPLDKLKALAPLFAGEWLSSRTVLDAGTSQRLVCAASIPRDVKQIVVTGHLKHDGRHEPYAASRLVAIG